VVSSGVVVASHVLGELSLGELLKVAVGVDYAVQRAAISLTRGHHLANEFSVATEGLRDE